MAYLVSYCDRLPVQAKTRYQEKIRLIGSLDPFLLPANRGLANPSTLPPVEASDIVSYLGGSTTVATVLAVASLASYNLAS